MKIPARARGYVTALSVLLTTGLALSACGFESGAETKAVRAATIPGISSLPIKVASDRGFFRDHGIEVELTEGTNVAAWQSAVGKQFDIVLSNASSYTQSVSKGLPNVLINNMVNANADYSQNSLAAKEPVEDLAQLRGATIGVLTLTGLPTQMLKYQLNQAGLDTGDYELVSMPYSAQADNLRAGNVDAVMTAKPYEVALRQAGFWVSPDDVCVQALTGITNGAVGTCSSVMFVASSEWVNGNSDDVKAWLASLNDAIEFITSNPDKAVEILQNWVGYSDKLAADVELPSYSLSLPMDQLEPVWKVLAANNVVSGGFPKDAIRTWKE